MGAKKKLGAPGARRAHASREAAQARSVRGEADVAQLWFRARASLLLSITSASRARDPDRPRPVSRGATGGSRAGGPRARPPGRRASGHAVTTCHATRHLSRDDLSVDTGAGAHLLSMRDVRWADGRARADQGRALLHATSSLLHTCGALVGAAGRERHNPLSNTHGAERREHTSRATHRGTVTVTCCPPVK